MLSKSFSTLLFVVSSAIVVASGLIPRAPDPCAVISGKKWVLPSEVRACFTSFKVDEAAKTNILDVIEKTLAFHSSVNYQVRALQPFTFDVHEDVLLDLARIRRQKYPSDYDLHIDISRTLKRLNDGHCSWTNYCYDGLFSNYIPLPLTLLTDDSGIQSVHIANEAFNVSSAEFADSIDFWQNALPGNLKGQLSTLSGAKVLLINGLPPFASVDYNTLIAGSYQALGTRQIGFFSSYRRVASGWGYLMGNFAQQSLPLSDNVLLTIQRVNHTFPDTIVVPYRSKIGASTLPFNDTASWRAQMCTAGANTNGKSLYSSSKSPKMAPKHFLNTIMDDSTLTDIVLPPTLQPALVSVSGSLNVAQFYLSQDRKTGILALGSFSDTSYNNFLQALLDGLLELKSLGATQLIVDVTNNGGGFICAAQWLHRIIAGPKSTTVPQAGFDTTVRDGPLAQLIVKKIVNENRDPNIGLLYNPLQWRNASNEFFDAKDDWLQPPVSKIINGRQDAFSQKLGQECQPEGFPSEPPSEALFDPTKVVIVSNGRCASSCSLFSIAMQKLEGSKTVVVGGKKEVTQQYCGTIGGQSTDFVTIDTEIKTTGLKNNTLAPPDMTVNGVLGITWRLAYGVDNPTEPAEWQDHTADLNLPLTAKLANNPVAIWEEVAKRLLS